LTFVKVKIALAILFTAFVSYFLINHTVDFLLFKSMLGIFMLASGALSLNQVQEMNFDSQMNRTLNRPLPSEHLSKSEAVIIAFSFIFIGFAILCLVDIRVFALGFLNIFLYNFVYTYLKRISVFAIIPGALVGVIPLYMAWISAHGNITDIRIIYLAIFMLVWQFPHFFLILSYYDGEYKSAGFPNIKASIKAKSIRWIVIIWYVAMCCFCALMPFYNLLDNIYLYVLINIYCLFSVLVLINKWIVNYSRKNYKFGFALINIQMLLVFLLLFFNSFL
jgi:protoheme IX farnesyltransferase